MTQEPGNHAGGERVWASEDLGCRSEIRRDVQADQGSPDSQRAASLDASECLADTSSLGRSSALEDLTCLGALWMNQSQGAPPTPVVQSPPQSHLDSPSNSFLDGSWAGLPRDPAAGNSSDICNDSRSSVAPTTGAARLQKTPPQSRAATRSLVPKGPFPVAFRSGPARFVDCFHFFEFQRRFYCDVMQHLPLQT